MQQLNPSFTYWPIVPCRDPPVGCVIEKGDIRSNEVEHNRFKNPITMVEPGIVVDSNTKVGLDQLAGATEESSTDGRELDDWSEN